MQPCNPCRPVGDHEHEFPRFWVKIFDEENTEVRLGMLFYLGYTLGLLTHPASLATASIMADRAHPVFT